MKKKSVGLIAFCIFFGLLFSSNVVASVYIKKQNLSSVSLQLSSKTEVRVHQENETQNLKDIPFGKVAFYALKWRLAFWIEHNSRVLRHKNAVATSSGCFKIKKSNGQIILASTYEMVQDSIQYRLCNTTDSTLHLLHKMEVDRIEGSNGYLFYGRNKFTIKKIGGGIILASTYRRERDSIKYTLNNSSNSTEYGLSIKEVDRIEGSNGYLFYVGDYTSFEYNSLLAFVTSGLAWAAWLGLFSTLGYILAIGLMLASVYFSIASLRLLRRPGLDYGGQWFAYFLDVVAIISNLGLGFLMWALAGYLYL